MNSRVIVFDGVTMKYPLYHHLASGIKGFILHFRASLRGLRNDRFTALRDISFEIHKGEKVGIIGRNGAGKSTTLGLIAGVLRPTTGTVEINGRISPFLELGAGFHPDLTGRENIELNGVLMGLRRNDVLAMMEQIVDFSELGQFVDQPIRTYSSGMLSRLGFSVVAHLNPEILLIDEVLAVGDAAFNKKCIGRMMKFKESEVTMVFVSHSMEDVKRVCDRVMWIEDHTIRMTGTPEEVVNAYLGSIAG
jgi:homopolymeric O-antigen transport system ATP-binding protein